MYTYIKSFNHDKSLLRPPYLLTILGCYHVPKINFSQQNYCIKNDCKMYLFRAILKLGIFMQTNLLQAYLKEAEI